MLLRALLVAALAVAGLVPPGAAAESGTPHVTYRLGLLVRGKAWTPVRTARTDSIQAGHMANMGRMWRHGALLAAGPFENGGDLRGVFVFRPGDDPLDSLMAGDSAIATGRLECRVVPWVAPAGLGEDYRRNADQVARTGQGTRDSMVTFGWVMLEKGPRHGAGDPAAARELADRHLAHARKLQASGRVVFAGTVEGDGDLRGVLVMQGDSAQAAAAMADDPAVREGWFTPRVLTWWTARGNIPGH
jgi:uncharacterized protein YciI